MAALGAYHARRQPLPALKAFRRHRKRFADTERVSEDYLAILKNALSDATL